MLAINLASEASAAMPEAAAAIASTAMGTKLPPIATTTMPTIANWPLATAELTLTEHSAADAPAHLARLNAATALACATSVTLELEPLTEPISAFV